LTRPILDPRFGYYSGQPGLGYPYGPDGLTAPGLRVPGTGIGSGGNLFGAGGVVTVAPATQLQQDQLTSNVTGHPTRFDSYARYFDNQGGQLTGTSGLGLAPNATGPAGATPGIFGATTPPSFTPIIGGGRRVTTTPTRR
jgi:hypothetical protein